MNKYFSNPELKRSTLFIAAIAFLFIAAAFLLINLSFNNIKNSYIKNNTALAGAIIEKHPKMKNEIVPLITKRHTYSQFHEGKRLLEQYGYDINLNIELVQDISRDYNFIKIRLIILIAMTAIITIIFNYFNHASIYRKVNKLIAASRNIANLNYNIDIYEEKEEGLFSKLAVSFHEMREIVKNNYNQVSNEKSFLVNILSDISHQLKTPIASLVIYNDILLNRNVNDADRIKFLENSRSQLNRMEWLTKSLLQLAKLDAGVIKFQKREFDLNKTLEASVNSLKARAMSGGVNVEFRRLSTSVMMAHDSNWMCEALTNIIKNSIEHAKVSGQVIVGCESNHVCTRITIEDDGEGIEKNELPYIFKRFYKGKENKNTESVGIGLALAKAIIEAHDGLIEVKSSKTKGTKFTIIFLA